MIKNQNQKRKVKILCIDPGTREMGVAFLEDWELLDYGVKTIKRDLISLAKKPRNRKALFRHLEEIITRLIEEKSPDIIAIEKNLFSQNRNNLILALAVAKIKEIAKREKVSVVEYNPRTVRKTICNNGNATKKELARTIAMDYPELKVYLESDKKWKQRYWQNIFDAIAVGLTYILKNNPTKV